MKVQGFVGGEDVQRSLNLSDNQCVNLYPTANNDGNITAFYKVDGLKQEAVLSGIPTGAYKTSTGRAFYVAGTTLYELNANLTSTSRGTLTAGNYSFSDNGIELICVNGIDGWLLVLATNSLTKIKVLTGTFTVSVASPAVVTATGHGLIAGDRVIFSSTGVLPSGLTTSTPYYVLAAGLTANAFEVSLTAAGAAINTVYVNDTIATVRILKNATTCTISNASPAVITQVGHTRIAGDKIYFATTGTLPSPLVDSSASSCLYYVIATGLTADTFQISASVNGTAIATTTAGSGTHTLNPFVPSEININQSGLVGYGDIVALKTTGALPTGLTSGTEYYSYGLIIIIVNIAGVNYLQINSTSFKDSDLVKFYTSVEYPLLPTGINEGQSYYLKSVNTALYASYLFSISDSINGTSLIIGSLNPNGFIIFSDIHFSLTTIYRSSAGGIGFSGTQSGVHTLYKQQQYGTHTYLTLGYGFPNGCKTVSYMNGRFIACEPNTQNFYVSEPLDGWYWDQLNVQTVDSNPDYCIGQVVSHNELIVFCENSGEVFYDSGTVPTPFVRNRSGIFEIGCASPYSIAKLDNSVFWLGRSDEGKGIVYRLDGYTPVRISTFGIENSIQSMSTISDARAFSYQKDGHHFYVLTFPTGNKTFVFDANSNLWHERAQFISSTLGRWEAQDHLFFNNTHYVTDSLSSNLYSIDSSTYSNGANPIKIIRSFRAPSSDMKRVTHHRLQLEAEFGVTALSNPESEIMLRWSNDGGHTWSNLLNKGIGAVGEYFKRVIWNRLGMTKGPARIYEISCTDDVKLMLKDVYLE